MTKAELILAIAEKTKVTKRDSGKALDALTEVITEMFTKDDKVHPISFGTFESRTRAARTGINPQTKKRI